MKYLKPVIDFLEANGFTSDKNQEIFKNKRCEITIVNSSLPYYAIKNLENDYQIYSNDFNVYWLIGVLIWNKFIECKDIKI